MNTLAMGLLAATSTGSLAVIVRFYLLEKDSRFPSRSAVLEKRNQPDLARR
jgi:hypothetical protein